MIFKYKQNKTMEWFLRTPCQSERPRNKTENEFSGITYHVTRILAIRDFENSCVLSAYRLVHFERKSPQRRSYTTRATSEALLLIIRIGRATEIG